MSKEQAAAPGELTVGQVASVDVQLGVAAVKQSVSVSESAATAVDTSGNNTGLVAGGAWTATVPAPQPTASSVSPNSGLGSSQIFTFAFSDTQNPLNITGMAMLINSSSAFTQACYIIVDRIEGTIALAYDSALGSSSKPFSSNFLPSRSICDSDMPLSKSITM